MRRLLPLIVLFTPSAMGQGLGLPGLPKADEGSAIRVADDPRTAIQRERKAAKEEQQGLVLAAQDATRWEERRGKVRKRRSEVQALRRKLLSDEEPEEVTRHWIPDAPEEIEDTPPDAGVPDAAPPKPDGGVDGGAKDGGPADGARPDGGADGGPDGGVPEPEPAPAPEPAPEPEEDEAQELVLLPLLKAGEQFLLPGVHPLELEEIDHLIANLDALDEALSTLLRLYNEQRTHLTTAITLADQMLQAMEATIVEAQKKTKTGEKKAKAPGLREVGKLALKEHLARIELSLVRARKRQGAQEDELAGTEAAEMKPLPGIEGSNVEPIAAFTESYAKAEAFRREVEGIAEEERRLSIQKLQLTEGLRSSRARHDRLELTKAERELERHEESLRKGLRSMRISAEEVEWANRKLAKSQTLRGKAIPRLESQRDELRRKGGVGGAGNDPFSAGRVRGAQDALLAEKITFERLKLQRDTFRSELTQVLREVFHDVEPPPEFIEKHRTILEEEQLERRIGDLKARCDGWRRAQNRATQGKPSADRESARKAMLKAYVGLADVCMREDWVFGTQRRLSMIASYNFERFEWRSRGFTWYGWRALVSLLILAFVVFIARLLGHVTHRLAEQEEEEAVAVPTTGPPPAIAAFDPRKMWGKARGLLALVLYLGGFAALWLYAIRLTSDWVWGIPIPWSSLLGWASHPIFFVGDRGVSVWSMAQVFVWTVGAIYVARLIQHFISENLLAHFRVDRGIRDAVGTIVRYVVIFAGIGFGLGSAGIGLGALTVVFGVIGIGIGFGLQTIAANFISGFILLLERPVRKGDFVEVDDMIGEVKNISARATTIETRDAVSVIVPNSEFITKRVINWTLGRDERVRTQVKVGVAYGSDVKLVEKCLLEAAKTQDKVLQWPTPQVHMRGFDDSSLEFVLHIWTRAIRGLPELVSELNKQVDDIFRREGIDIPFPQRTLHHTNAPVLPEGDEGDET